MKIHTHIKCLLLFCFLAFSTMTFAQCDIANFTSVPQQNPISCFANGIIEVNVPGGVNCTNIVATITSTTGYTQSINVNPDGTSTGFTGLSAGTYSVSITDGVNTYQASNNPIVITSTYTNPLVTSSATTTSCRVGASNYTDDATLTVTIAANTGVGPFEISCAGADIPIVVLPASPGNPVSYTFTGLPAGLTPFTVIDQVNGQIGCETSQSQSRNIPLNSVNSIRWGMKTYSRQCAPLCDTFMMTFSVTTHNASQTSQVSSLGAVQISINGSPFEIVSNPIPIVGGVSFNYEVSPGDIIEMFASSVCHYISRTFTIPGIDNNSLNIINQTVVPSQGCNISYRVAVWEGQLIGTSTIRYNFCPINNLIIEQELPSGSGNWVNVNLITVSGTTNPSNPIRGLNTNTFNTYILPSAGSYRITASDNCHTITRLINISDPPLNPLTLTAQTVGTIVEGTGSIRIEPSDYIATITYTISPIPLQSPINFSASGPGTLAGNYELNFPISYTNTPLGTSNSTTRFVAFHDLPIGSYLITAQDLCGRTSSIIHTLTLEADFNENFNVINNCANSNRIEFQLNPNGGVIIWPVGETASLYHDLGGGTIGGLVATANISNANMSGAFVNVPSGNYIIRIGKLYGNGNNRLLSACFGDSSTLRFFDYLINVPDYENITVEANLAFCDVNNNNTAVIVANIMSGTPVYSQTWEVYDALGYVPNVSIPLQTYTAANSSASNALSQSFNNLPIGDYIVKVVNVCYSVEINATVAAPSVVPTATASQIFVCPNSNAVQLSIPMDPTLYDIIWTNQYGATVGTGTPVTVAVTETSTYTSTVTPKPIMACVGAPIYTSSVTVNLLSEITQLGSTSTICGPSGVPYTVSATFTGSFPFTAIGTGAPGTWVNNGNGTATWTSDDIAAGFYNVNIQDANACNVLNLTGASTCCVFEVTCPTFSATTVACYAAIPTATSLTEAQFEALGNADGVIGNLPCGVIEITASNAVDPGCEGNVIRTYTVTEYADPNDNDIRDLGEDTVLNTQNCIQTFTIERADFTMPANAASTVACPADVVAPTVPVVTDNCGNTLTPSAPVISAMPTCEGNVTYAYTFTDCEGNTHNWVYTYTIERLDFTMPANASSTVACPADVVAPTVPVVTDNCGNTLTPSAPVISAMPTCEGNVTYTYTFTDCEGNTHNWVYTYTIERLDFTMPANASSTVACPADVVAPTVPVVTDNCGNTLTPSAPVISAMPTCEGNVTYTYTFTDCEGNTHNWVYTYTIEREDFTMPANASSTVACPADVVAPTVPAVTDNCGNTLTPSAPVISAMPTCEDNVTYTYTFTDCEGNTHDWVYTYTIEREDFTMPANASSTVACPADVLAPTVPAVTDNCGNTLTPSAPVISAMPTCEGNVTYTYTFTDCEGNTHNWVYTYTIERLDFTMPANASSTVACPADVVAPTVPVVTDNCGNTLTPSAPVISAMPTCEGNATYTYTFTDCEGNTHNWVYTYTIEREDFTIPANAASTVACPADVVAPTVPAVTDACGNTLTPSAPVISVMPTCEGNVTYTYTFTDCEGNSHDWVYTYTIDDNIAPTGTVPANLTLQCITSIPLADVNAITDEADNCSGIVTVTVADTNNGGTGCLGNPYIISRTYTLTDCAGNTTDLVQTITVEDNIVPVFDGTLPSDLVLECTGNIPVAPTLTATDNCSVPTVIYDELRVNGSCPSSYTLTRTWTATDTCGNESAHVQTITVQDTTPPVFTGDLPQDGFADCDNIPVAPPLTATDNCGNVTITLDEQRIDGDCDNRYQLIRTWTATDDCGNASTYVQTLSLACHIKIWNAVSPNNDGKNDIFYLEGIECYPKNSVEIFNRWGVKVYETNGYDNVSRVFSGYSDGRSTISRNELLPTGTYFYVLKYEFSYDGVNGKSNIDKAGYLYIQNN
jgi:gliding motility-associated-like protein